MAAKQFRSDADALQRRIAERVGALIRQWRTDDAVRSREAMAPALGLSVRTLERLESGQADVRIAHLVAMESLHPGLVRPVMDVLSTETAKPVDSER